MQRTTEGPAPKARMGKGYRQQIASLAHAVAHEVVALREARGRVNASYAGIPTPASEVLDDMIAEREARIALMADEVAGHA